MPEDLLLAWPVVLAGGGLLLTAAILFATRRGLAKLAAQVRAVAGGPPGYNLERGLREQSAALRELLQRAERLEARLAGLEEAAAGSLQRLGLVRFNAFEDTGSDQSFALALIDDREDGIVLTSLYGRNESRIYAKPLLNGKCPYRLSGEELTALARARAGKGWTSLGSGQGGDAPARGRGRA